LTRAAQPSTHSLVTLHTHLQHIHAPSTLVHKLFISLSA